MNRSNLPFATAIIIAGLLLIATMASTPGETAQDFQSRIVLAETVAEPENAQPLNDAQEALQGELRALGEGFNGVAGIAVSEAETLATMAHNGDMPLPQQSVTKLWVSLAALDQVDKGALDLDERVTIGREDLTVFYQPIRDIVNARGVFRTDYADLMDRAITRSDNTANDRILRRIGGPDAVNAFLTANGIDGVAFGTDERTKQSAIAGLEWRQSYAQDKRAFFDARDDVPDARRREAFENYLADPMDGATAEGLALALARLARGDLLSDSSTTRIREILEETRSGPRRLKGGVPQGWTIGHKTGTGQFFDGTQSGYNDVGILTAPDGTDYALVVLIGQTRASYAARMEMMQNVTRAVVRYHEARGGPGQGADA